MSDMKQKRLFSMKFFSDKGKNEMLFGDLSNEDTFFQFFRETLQRSHGVISKEKAKKWAKLLTTPVGEEENERIQR